MWKKLLIVGIISLVVGLLIGWLLTKHFCQPEPTTPITYHDTVFRDSVHIKEVVKWRYRTEYDTIISHSGDIHNDDTANVQVDTIHIPIDHFAYVDSVVTDTSKVSWNVLYSGYHASIDTFILDWTFTPTVPVREKTNGWGQFVGIGIGIGAGAVISRQQVLFGPEVSINITYGWGYHWESRKLKK